MMLFDPKAALAKIENRGDTPATSATFATQTPIAAPCVAAVADVAALRPENQKIEGQDDSASRADMRHGVSVGGSPRTWTGRVVSLDEWRRLSEWERHGSTGKLWNGLTRQWEAKP